MDEEKIDLPLHETESIFTFAEYKKGVYAVNRRRQFYSIVKLSMAISGGVFLVALLSGRLQASFLLALALLPAVLLLVHAAKSRSLLLKTKQSFNSDDVAPESVMKFKFFWDYVEISDHHDNEEESDKLKTIEIPYDGFATIINTKTNFYLTSIVEAEEATFFLMKDNCSMELIDFLQELKKSNIVAIKRW